MPDEITFKGKMYKTPSLSRLKAWAFDGVSETPDGRFVEPDHPESWLVILKFI